MTEIVMAPVGPKGQITLPKKVRQLLGIGTPGQIVGFLVDTGSHTVRLSKMDLVPADPEFTEEESRALLKLAKSPGRKRFASPEAFLQYLRKL